jgi:hypothetical protein
MFAIYCFRYSVGSNTTIKQKLFLLQLFIHQMLLHIIYILTYFDSVTSLDLFCVDAVVRVNAFLFVLFYYTVLYRYIILQKVVLRIFHTHKPQ